jgi:hypothetical protein
MTRYLEITSSYRDRNMFPSPGTFDINISQSGSKNTLQTAFDPISLEAPLVTYTMEDLDFTGTITSLNTATLNSFILCVDISTHPNISLVSNYYRGIQLLLDRELPDLEVIIETWDYINSDAANNYFRVSFQPSIPLEIYSTITSVTSQSSVKFTDGTIFIPNGVVSSQTYKNWFVHNETQNLNAPVLTYDGNNSIASVDIDAVTTSPWLLTDRISIRKNLPSIVDVFQSGSTTSMVVLANTAQQSSFFTNGFLRITSSVNNNQIRKIISYDESTFTATLSLPLPVAPDSGHQYEILQFTRDNVSPFDYNGNTMSQDHCHEIRLINLILPNVSLKSGGRASDYPFVYVDLQTYSSTGVSTSIYSNNPNAKQTLFIVPMSDNTPPSVNSFLTLDKSSMFQTIKFSLYHNLKFKIRLPDGTPLEMTTDDTISPNIPNPNLQVSALFSVRRIM